AASRANGLVIWWKGPSSSRRAAVDRVRTGAKPVETRVRRPHGTRGLGVVRMSAGLQRRGRDPSLRPSATADPSTVRVTFEYLACATGWLLVGTAAGLIDALKLNWPDWLPVPWLSFGRVRPIHTNTVFWGWSSMALVGLALYVVARTSRAPLWSPRLARVAPAPCNPPAIPPLATLAPAPP